jgi:phosphatidylinositol alpha-1,6-mannosyltransferase
LRRVLFVSKPVAPPFHDGSKCLVRDVATHLQDITPVVMTSSDGAPLAANVELARVYTGTGHFHPGVRQNLRAAAWLLARAHADLWHFVFAPNPRTSRVGRVLSAVRRVPVVQTVASPPRRFEHVTELLFGQRVVAQSTWTRDELLAAYERERVPHGARRTISVIPPPVAPVFERSKDVALAARAALGIPHDAPLFVYPGDLEVSRGARTVAELVPELARSVPGCVVVFAYRAKSAAAPGIAAELERQLDGEHVRVTGEMPDVLALIASASAVLFPVDDLWGKVDLPIVLLESMALGVPVVALDHGPLRDLRGALLTPYGDNSAIVRAAGALTHDTAFREDLIARQRSAVREHYSAVQVSRAYERLYFELIAEHARAN